MSNRGAEDTTVTANKDISKTMSEDICVAIEESFSNEMHKRLHL